jgi:hypothetical protein
MIIVKPDAISIACRDCDQKAYHKSDTIEISDAEWRPDNWSIPEWVEEGDFEAGATSMLNALISLTGEGK